MRRKEILLLMGVFLALAMLSSVRSQEILFIEKQSYDLDDFVDIKIELSDMKDIYLKINDGTREYHYMNPPKNIRYYPVREGKYTLSVFKGNYLLDSTSFVVGDIRPQLYLDKQQYDINESAIISVQAEQYEGLSLEITVRDKRYVFFDISSFVKFIPEISGKYIVSLFHNTDKVSESSFSVGDNKIFKKTDFDFEVSSVKGEGNKKEKVEIIVKDNTVKKIEFFNFQLDEDAELKIKDVKKPLKINKKSALKTYAIDPSQLEFDEALVTAVATGNELWKCKDWDYDQQICLGSWVKLKDVTPGQNYSFLLTAHDPGFAETGIATINTIKPIYNLDDEVEIIIISLDDQGYLSDAELKLNILVPDGKEYIYEDKINKVSKGVYKLLFNNTEIEGNYLLNLNATIKNYTISSSSYFQVKQEYEFDILRNSPYTIDPWIEPFNTNIKIISKYYKGKFNFTEILPVEFEIIDKGKADIYYDLNYIYLRWYNLTNNSMISYRANSPKITPSVYVLGPSYIDYGDVFYEARPWYLAIDPIDDVSFYDPFSTVSQNWDLGTGLTFSEIDDSIRYPNTPDTNDYIADKANDNVISEFGFSPITQGNINSITLWVYTSTGSNAIFTYYLQQSGTTRCSDPVPVATSSSWRSCTWNNPTGDLSGLTLELGGVTKSGGGATENAYVYATYLEINYTDNDPMIVSLNYPVDYENISSSSVDFNFTAYDDYGFTNCSLFMNISGWSRQNTISSITNNSNNNILASINDGKYKWNILCYDNSSHPQSTWFTSNYTVTIDTKAPEVSNLYVNPEKQVTNLPINVTAEISDLVAIDNVFANIVLPNSSDYNISMFDIDADGIYNATFFSTSLIGKYNVTIIANDTLSHINDSVKSSFNITLENLSITTDKDPYVRTETVYIYGKGFNPFVNVTLKIFEPYGDPFLLPVNLSSNSTGGINYSIEVPEYATLGTYEINATDTSEISRSINGSFEIVSAVIETVSNSYQQGQFVYISGYNWDPDVNVTINMTLNDGIVFGPLNISSNSTGNINYTWFLPYDADLGNYIVSGIEPSNPGKSDDYTFLVVERPVTIGTGWPWYRTSEILNISGSGFSPDQNVFVDIKNSTGDSITDFPIIISSNITGNINKTKIVDYALGNYTIIARDTIYPNLNSTYYFKVVKPNITTDRELYNDGDTITIIGNYWSRLVNVTLDIINETGLSESGYPLNVSTNITGGFEYEATTRAIGLTQSFFNITAFEPLDSHHNASTNYSTLRQAELSIDKQYYLQKEIVEINGSSYTPLDTLTLWIRYISNKGVALNYPRTISTDAAGRFTHNFNISTYCPGEYTVVGTDDTNSAVLNASINFTVREWWNTSWEKRMPILLSNQGKEKTNVPILLNITGLAGDIISCADEIRVISTQTNTEVPINHYGGDDNTWCEIEFLGSISANVDSEQKYYVYYNNSDAIYPNYEYIGDTENIFYDYFNSAGIGNWTQDAQNDWDYDTERSYDQGGGALHVDGAATNAYVYPTNSFNISSDLYREVNMSYAWFIESSFDGGENIRLEFFDGVSWNPMDSLDGQGGGPPGPEENIWMTNRFTLTSTYYIEDYNFRFISTVSGADEDGHVDVVLLRAVLKGTKGISASLGSFEQQFTCERIDAISPMIEILVPGNYHNTTDPTPMFNFTVIDDLDYVLNFTVYVDDIPNGQNNTVQNNTEISINISELSEGKHNITIVANDDYNNQDNDTRFITIDYSGPITNITTPVNFTNISENSKIVRVNIHEPYTEIDTLTLIYKNNILPWTLLCEDDTIPYQCEWDLTSLEDSNSYEIRAYSNDTLGNMGYNYTVANITLDRTGPEVIITDPINFTNVSENQYLLVATANDLLKEVDTVTFLFWNVSNERWAYACSEDNYPYDCNWRFNNEPDSKHYSFRAYGNDTLGNIGLNYTVYNVTIDRTGPQINNISFVPNPQLLGYLVNISVNFTDLSRIDYAEARVILPNSEQINLRLDDNGLYNATFHNTTLTGDYQVTIYANDSLGNEVISEISNFTIDYHTLQLLTNKDNYVIDETSYISGYGFNALNNVTLNIKNSSGDLVTGYPRDYITNSTGGFNASWIIPSDQALGTYIINATDKNDSSRSIVKQIELVSAIIASEKNTYLQSELINVLGLYWDYPANITINITDPDEKEVFGPINVSSNSTGNINISWQSDYNSTLGTYIISAYEPQNPLKQDTHLFTMTQRPVSVSVDYPWYKNGDLLNLNGYGFSPDQNIRLEIINSLDTVIFGPINIISNNTGSINYTYVVNLIPDNYTLNLTDTKYKNLNNHTVFEVNIQQAGTDKSAYTNGQTIYISGEYWTRNTNFTIEILNISGLPVSGYPKNISSYPDGHIEDSLTAEAIGLGSTLYNVSIFNPQKVSENASFNYSVQRVAILSILDDEVDQYTVLNLTGQYFSQDNDIQIYVKYLNDTAVSYYYPKTESTDSVGNFTHVYNTTNICEGQYIIEARDLSFSSLYANISFNVSFLNANSSLEYVDSSSPSGQYNVYSSQFSRTYSTSDSQYQYIGGADYANGQNYEVNFNAYLNYTINISSLDADPARITNVSFGIDYCYSGVQANPSCGIGFPQEGKQNGPQYISIFNFSSNQWKNITELTVPANDFETSHEFYFDNPIQDFVQEDNLNIRFEIDFNQSNYSDVVLVLDYIGINFSYDSEVNRNCEAKFTPNYLESRIYGNGYNLNSESRIDISNISGSYVDSGSSNYFKYIPFDQLNVLLTTAYSDDNITLSIYQLNYTSSVNISSQIVENYSYPLPTMITNITPIVALNDTNINFNKTQIKIPKRGIEVNTILHCINYSYPESRCYEFEYNELDDYEFNETEEYIFFNVTSFDSFGGASGSTLPNITNIYVYNVSGLDDKHIGGTLIISGLNKTFYLQYDDSYRIEFKIRNDGRAWFADSSDIVYHSGLNESWQISSNDIWYVDSDNLTNYTGGTFSSGVVGWNLTQGGKFKSDEYGVFSYVVNITTNKSEEYPVYFFINDTSKGSGSYDSSVFNITDILKPSITLNLPINYANISSGIVTFNWTVFDNSGENLSCDLLLNEHINKTAESIPNIPTLINITILKAELYNWSVNCTDQSGNNNITEIRYFYTMNPPSDIDINMSSDNTSMILNWTEVSSAEFYNIYYTDNLIAGFGETPNVTGITDLNWTDTTAFEHERRYYKVSAARGSSDALSTVIVGKHTKEMQHGWNLISIPFNITEWRLYDGNSGRDIFTSPGNCLASLWYYNASNQSYLRTDYSGKWTPAIGSEALTNIEPGRGYWAETNKLCNMTFFGKVPQSNLTFELEEYWNIVGQYSGKEQLLYDETLSKPVSVNPEGSTVAILRYNYEDDKFEVTVYYPGWGWWPSYNNQDFLYLEPFRGYYFDQNETAQWTHNPN